jgi:hypothetical protein
MEQERMNGNRQQDDEAWLRAWTIPEEERAQYTSQPWTGEYRWFKSDKVICIEQARRKREQKLV